MHIPSSARAMIACAVLLCPTATLADPLPNPKLTPGVIRSELSERTICNTRWGKDHRAVTEAMKREVFESYGFKDGNKDPRCPCEIDHFVSRELGGADDVKNLWPQSYSGEWNAHMKDRVENRLHVELCAGRMTLPQVQDAVKAWTETWTKFFGESK